MNDLPTRDQFAEHLKEEFVVSAEGRDTVVILDRVSDLEKHGMQEGFSLFFTAPGDSGILQYLYTVKHPALPEMELFLVPIALDERGLRLQAAFSQLTL